MSSNVGTPDPLANLHDLALPPPISWWPPAPGWWILAVLLLITLVVVLRWAWRWYQYSAPKRAALQQLKQRWKAYQQHQNGLQLVREIEILLKQMALCRFPNEQVAPLHGQHWLQFLDKTGQTQGFTRGVGHWLGEGLYQAKMPQHQPAQLQALVDLCRQWIKRQ